MINICGETLYTRRDAAKYLGYQYLTLQYLAANKKGPNYRKIGRIAYYTKEDLDAYLTKITKYRKFG